MVWTPSSGSPNRYYYYLLHELTAGSSWSSKMSQMDFCYILTEIVKVRFCSTLETTPSACAAPPRAHTRYRTVVVHRIATVTNHQRMMHESARIGYTYP